MRVVTAPPGPPPSNCALEAATFLPSAATGGGRRFDQPNGWTDEDNEARRDGTAESALADRRHSAGCAGCRRSGLLGCRASHRGRRCSPAYRRRVRHGCQDQRAARFRLSGRDGRRHHRTDAAAGHESAAITPYSEALATYSEALGRQQAACAYSQPARGFQHSTHLAPRVRGDRGILGRTDQARRPVPRSRDRLRGS